MIRTVEAVIDERGNVRLLETVDLGGRRRALVMILDDEVHDVVPETTLLSEAALAKDWNDPEEERAWSRLRPEP